MNTFSGREREGFVWTFDHYWDGKLQDRQVIHNLIPDEGLDYDVKAPLGLTTTITTWYAGLFKGNYTPTGAETAANVDSSATECTEYSSTTRPVWTPARVAVGEVDNSAAVIEFTMTSAVTVYGGFLISSNTKQGTSGTLLSIARLDSPDVTKVGSVIKVTAGIRKVNG